jgi:hypothetical protein
MANRAARAAHQLLDVGDQACAVARGYRAGIYLSWAALHPPTWMSTYAYLRRYSQVRRLVVSVRDRLMAAAELSPCPFGGH